MSKITIKDIAKLVGVSTATVSNYLNGNLSRMSDKTQQRLQEVIASTHYRPSNVAQQLAKNETRIIGVSVVDITNPFTSTLLSGIYDTCGKAGYSVVFTNANSDAYAELDNIHKLRQQDVAGLIIHPTDPDNPIFKILTNDNVVFVDRQSAVPVIDTIVTDNFLAARAFVSDMSASGYEELYFATWPIDNVSTRRLRYQGFQAATGCKDDSHLLIVDPGQPSDTLTKQLASIMQASRQKRTGFFTMNAKVLIHLLAILQNLGYSYPQDFGIGTYEDLDWMSILHPGVSSIRQDSFQLGVTAVETLLEKLSRPKNTPLLREPRLLELPTIFMKRDSY